MDNVDNLSNLSDNENTKKNRNGVNITQPTHTSGGNWFYCDPIGTDACCNSE
jgi:hypothetical protein